MRLQRIERKEKIYLARPWVTILELFRASQRRRFQNSGFDADLDSTASLAMPGYWSLRPVRTQIVGPAVGSSPVLPASNKALTF